MLAVFYVVFSDDDSDKIGRLLLNNWSEIHDKSKIVIDFFDDGGMLGGMEAYHSAGEVIGEIIFLGMLQKAV